VERQVPQTKGDDLEMQSDHGAFGGVRHALQPAESRQVKQVAQEFGGLTRDEIREIARSYKVTTKPIHHALEELRLPVLRKREAPLPGSVLAALKGDTTLPKPTHKVEQQKTRSDEDQEIKRLRRENAKLLHEVEEARRIRAQADADLAKARKSIADTAELRRQTASERDELEEIRQEAEALEEALRKCRLVLESLAGRYAEVVPRLSKSQLEDIIEKAGDELQRRKEGGHRARWP
jgi:predicted RNase H-like nuclease (RuvC/YqgF family)